MKTRLIFLILLNVCFSCRTSNKPLSDAQKEKIKGEVKEVVNAFIKGAEEANFDMAMTPWLDSPDFVYIYNGASFDYKGIVDAMKPVYSEMLNQKVTIVNEKYAFLDKSLVIYTSNCKSLENYKDGHAVLEDPAVIQITFRKFNNKWMAINGLESSVRQNAKNTETSKGLNQVELFKQFLGSWKSKLDKDTTEFSEVKPYGMSFELNDKYVTKKKIVREYKQLYGYIKKDDKYIVATIYKGEDMGLGIIWFTSNNKYIMIPYSDITNPEKATIKFEGEFKSPDAFEESYIVNNKPIVTDTYTRIK